MELPIKHKRGTTVPTANDLVVGEIAINTATGLCYTKTGAGNVVAIGLDVAANWGNIGGTLSSQTDLQTALDGKYSTSNPSGYIDGSALMDVVYNTEPRIIALDTSFIPQQGYSTYAFDLTYFDGFVGAFVTTPITINSPIGYYDGWTVTLDNNFGVGTVVMNTGAKTVLIGCQASDLQAALMALSFGVGSSGYNWYVIGTGSPYAPSSELALSAQVSAIPTDLTNSPAMKFLFREELLSELSRLARNANTTDAVLSVDANGLVSFDTNWASLTDLSGYALKSGDIFTGKLRTTATASTAPLNVAVSTSSPTTTVAGDVWVGTNNLFFKDSTNAQRIAANVNSQNTFQSPQIIQATTTSNLLRVTQLGTGNAVVVEDGNSQNPDTDAFVINNAGAVGIGVNSNTWVATEKLQINGYATSTTAPLLDEGTRLATTSHVKNSIRGVVQNIGSSGWALGWLTGYANVIVRVSDDGSSGQMIVPTESPEYITIGTQYVFIQTGILPFTIAPDGAGVQVKSFGSKYTSGGQHAVCTLIKTGVGEWYLAGNLV